MRLLVLPVLVGMGLVLGGCMDLLINQTKANLAVAPPFDPDDFFPLEVGRSWVMVPGDGRASSPPGFGTSTVSITAVETVERGRSAHATFMTREGVLTGHTAGGSSTPFQDRWGTLRLLHDDLGLVSLATGTSATLLMPGSVDVLRLMAVSVGSYATPRRESVPFLHLTQAGEERTLADAASASPAYGSSQAANSRQTAHWEATVSVPAGTFASCLKLVITRVIQEQANFPDRPSTTRQDVAETTYWLAKGVGIVKKAHRMRFGNQPQTMDAEEVLASYSIPARP